MKALAFTACLAGLFVATVMPMHAGLLYSVEFTPSDTISGAGVPALDFSFSSPDVITSFGALDLTPFDVTVDITEGGTSSVTIELGDAITCQGDGFAFATSSSQP
jgi:hypothetical protein